MTVKGNHPLAETIAKDLFGIETVPIEGVRRMVNKAARDAVAYHTAALTEYAEAQRKADAQFVRDFAKNYPVDIFTPNPEGELTDIQVIKERAETMRIMCPLIARAIEDKEES